MKVINNKKGFTLIELLVVVAIIGILSSVGVVAYNGYTAGAKESACKGNFRTLVKSVYENIMWCELNPTINFCGIVNNLWNLIVILCSLAAGTVCIRSTRKMKN